jgi:hypothetical protein
MSRHLSAVTLQTLIGGTESICQGFAADLEARLIEKRS